MSDVHKAKSAETIPDAADGGSCSKNARHEPGPWLIDCENNLIYVNDLRKTIICNLGNVKNPWIMADARLIAAAPELLAALSDLRDCINETRGPNAHAALDRAVTALSKAKGEE